MLTVHNISKSFGVETVLDSVTFNLNPGERVGLVGPNGCGKTTLLRIIAGIDQPDSGHIRFNSFDLRVGYLPQGLTPEPGDTVGSFIARAEGDIPALTTEVERLAAAVALAPSQADLHRQYDNVLSQLTAASENQGRAPAVLAALGLEHIPLDTPSSALSGGQKTRLGLASILLADPHLLLLDEPTNHLDFDMLEWLEDWILGFKGVLLLVSHDRAFLDATADHILELDPATHATRMYAGNYTDYLEEKLAEREKQWQAYTDRQEEIVQLQNAARHLRGIAKFRKGGKADSGDKFAKGFFGNRSRATISRAKQIEARIERLHAENRIEKPHTNWQMKLEFGEIPAGSRDVLMLEGLSVGYQESIVHDTALSAAHDSPHSVAERRVRTVVVLRDLNAQLRYGTRCALIGPNGAGKTTLLRTIAGSLPALAGRARLGASVRMGYMAQEQEGLDPQLNAFDTVRAIAPMSDTGVRAFLHLFLFSGDDVFVPAGSLSFGERARLSLACLVAGGCNFLMLDEPINHLDIPARARFEQALSVFQGTVLAVVHDRYFITGFANEIWEIGGGKLTTTQIAEYSKAARLPAASPQRRPRGVFTSLRQSAERTRSAAGARLESLHSECE